MEKDNVNYYDIVLSANDLYHDLSDDETVWMPCDGVSRIRTDGPNLSIYLKPETYLIENMSDASSITEIFPTKKYAFIYSYRRIGLWFYKTKTFQTVNDYSGYCCEDKHEGMLYTSTNIIKRIDTNGIITTLYSFPSGTVVTNLNKVGNIHYCIINNTLYVSQDEFATHYIATMYDVAQYGYDTTIYSGRALVYIDGTYYLLRINRISNYTNMYVYKSTDECHSFSYANVNNYNSIVGNNVEPLTVYKDLLLLRYPISVTTSSGGTTNQGLLQLCKHTKDGLQYINSFRILNNSYMSSIIFNKDGFLIFGQDVGVNGTGNGIWSFNYNLMTLTHHTNLSITEVHYRYWIQDPNNKLAFGLYSSNSPYNIIIIDPDTFLENPKIYTLITQKGLTVAKQQLENRFVFGSNYSSGSNNWYLNIGIADIDLKVVQKIDFGYIKAPRDSVEGSSLSVATYSTNPSSQLEAFLDILIAE